MPKSTNGGLDLDVDLQGGVVPISKAASALAALIKRGKERQQPIIVTQKGYPTGVLLPIDLYTTLRDMAQREGITSEVLVDVNASPDQPEPEAAEPEAPAPRRPRGGRRANADQ